MSIFKNKREKIKANHSSSSSSSSNNFKSRSSPILREIIIFIIKGKINAVSFNKKREIDLIG